MIKKIDVNFIKSEFQKIHNYFLSQKYLIVIEKTKILIKKDPNQVPFYNYLGLSYKQTKQYDLAVQVLKKGLKLFPKSITIINNLGSVYRAMDQYSEAEKYFNLAMSINANDTNVLINFANLKRDQNKISESIILYEKAYTINNNIETLLINLAGAYQIIGDFDKSKEMIKMIQEKFPNNTTADKMFSVIHEYKKNDAHQALMLKKLENNLLPQQDKCKLFYALSKSYEDQNDIKNSVKYFVKGNNETYNLFGDYQFKKEVNRFNKIKEIFKDLRLPNISPNTKPRLIFIVGMPRSGTTLTHQIISSHSNVFGAGELSILSNYFSEKIFNEHFLNKIFQNNLLNEIFVNEISNYLYKLFKENDNNKIILDKSPLNFEWIGFIKMLFPDAKVINCKRNLQDIALSIYKNTFDGSSLPWSYSQENIIKFISMYKDLMKFWEEKLPNFIFHCSYENLVNNPKDEIPKIIKFCNLDWEDDCLNFTKNKTAIKTVSIAQARKPIYKTSVNAANKFREYLDFLRKISPE